MFYVKKYDFTITQRAIINKEFMFWKIFIYLLLL